jgi:hypothetical protein
MAVPCLPGQWWRPEDSVRLFRFLARPLIVAAVILLVSVVLLFGAQYTAPLLTGGGIGSPSHFTAQSQERETEERQLDAEIDVLLASFEVAPPESPTGNAQLP